MINQFLIIISTVCIYEFLSFFKLKGIIITNIKIYKKIIKLFTCKKVSDFRKEMLILNYSKLLLISSIRIIVLFIGILIFLLTLYRFSSSFIIFLLSIYGIFEITISFLIYHYLRKKLIK